MTAIALELVLPWPAPPLRQNDRGHWAKHAGLKKAVRRFCWANTKTWIHDQPEQAYALRRAAANGDLVAETVWTVTDNRRRDAENIAPTGKAALDGICEALGIDDTHTVIHRTQQRIQRGPQQAVAIRLLVEAPADRTAP
jgi:crossover junction endodeoxyribonuclease RusA